MTTNMLGTNFVNPADLTRNVGIVLTAMIGFIVFKQHLDLAAILGITLIILGVLVINVFSTSSGH